MNDGVALVLVYVAILAGLWLAPWMTLVIAFGLFLTTLFGCWLDARENKE